MNVEMNPANVEACCPPLGDEVLQEQEAVEAAVRFKALGDPARVRIVNRLAVADGPVCVCDLTPEIGLSQATVSFHLKKLLGAGLVEREQRGKWAFYSIRQGALEGLATVLDPGV